MSRMWGKDKDFVMKELREEIFLDEGLGDAEGPTD